MNKETIIISLGGSLIVPDLPDVGFLKSFKDLILSQIPFGKRFIIVTGGGKTCRRYQEAGKMVTSLNSEDLDWMGIHATRFNAEFMKTIFGFEHVEEKIITDPTLPINFVKPIILAGGWKPGNSTDYVAVLLAKLTSAKKIINLSNIDYVYDSDPKTNGEAKKIENISWSGYRNIIPKEWNPGLNSPFDPVASEVAEKEGMEVIIMNGKPIDNLANFLKGEKFLGTVIS